MATTFADLENRVRGVEARTIRAEEDVTAIIETVMETRTDLRKLTRKVDWLATAVGLLLDDRGITAPPLVDDEDGDTDSDD